jgi:hypothetical protein
MLWVQWLAEGSAQLAMMFFDALNVSNFDSGKHESKPFKDPYRSPTDFRLRLLVAMYNSISKYGNM